MQTDVGVQPRALASRKGCTPFQPIGEPAVQSCVPYRIRRKESVEEAFRRIALEQIDRATSEAKNPNPHQGIHNFRRRCKKLRGLLRLVRAGFTEFDAENELLRDAARLLGPLRDAVAQLQTFHTLASNLQPTNDGLTALLKQLERERDESFTTSAFTQPPLLDEALDRLASARTRVSGWVLNLGGFDAIRDGLERTYRRSRSAMRSAGSDTPDEHLHEWRKQAKYHWHHMCLLRSLWPDEFKARRQSADRLAETLGLDHDLAVLRDQLVSHADESQTGAALELLDARRLALQEQAHRIGATLLAEKPGAFVKRINSYWRAWR